MNKIKYCVVLILFFSYIFTVGNEQQQTPTDSLRSIAEQLKKDEQDALAKLIIELGLTSFFDKPKENAHAKCSILRKCYSERPAYKNVSPHILDIVRSVLEREKIPAENVIIHSLPRSYYKSRNVSATSTFVQDISKKPIEKDVPSITFYKTFSYLSPSEQKKIAIHETEHLLQGHFFTRKALLKAQRKRYGKSMDLQNRDKYSSAKTIDDQLFKAENFKNLSDAEEKTANIMPAIRHADYAVLFCDICSADRKTQFSDEECELLKKIKQLHENSNKESIIIHENSNKEAIIINDENNDNKSIPVSNASITLSGMPNNNILMGVAGGAIAGLMLGKLFVGDR